jgi:hypothetical protein
MAAEEDEIGQLIFADDTAGDRLVHRCPLRDVAHEAPGSLEDPLGLPDRQVLGGQRGDLADRSPFDDKPTVEAVQSCPQPTSVRRGTLARLSEPLPIELDAVDVVHFRHPQRAWRPTAGPARSVPG